MPDGVYNVVQGEGETGAALANHPGCDKLSFTGMKSKMNLKGFYEYG